MIKYLIEIESLWPEGRDFDQVEFKSESKVFRDVEAEARDFYKRKWIGCSIWSVRLIGLI